MNLSYSEEYKQFREQVQAFLSRNWTPEDVAATIYYAMGLDPQLRITDPQGQPHPIALGEPIHGLLA